MSYPKTDPRANFTELEHELLAYWRENDTFHKTLEKTKLGHPFSFFDDLFVNMRSKPVFHGSFAKNIQQNLHGQRKKKNTTSCSGVFHVCEISL